MKTKNSPWIYALVGMLTTTVVLAFARLSYGVILPFMKDGLQISYKEAGYLGTTTSLGYLATVVFAGVLATKWGGRRTVILGISVVTLGFTGLAFSPFYWMTFLFMLLLGVGTAFTYTPFISLLVARFPLKKGLMIGLATSGAGIGILFAGMFVPYLTSVFPDIGWRMVWGIYAVIGLLVVILSSLFIHNPPMESNGVKSKQNTSLKEIYTNPNVIRVGLIYGIVGVTYIVQVIFVMSFMIESGVNSTVAGQLMAVNGILSIFSGFIWGGISDRLGRRFSLMATTSITTLAMLIPVLFPTILGFSVHIILMSCTITGLFTLIQASSMDYVKPSDMPVAFGYVTFYFAAGQLIGPTIAGWMIDGGGGFKTAFFFCSICLAIGFLLTVKMKNSAQVPQLGQELSAK
ncbi:Nitrate/nitrite transporter NarK [Mesobacillus persicus]|uniref:Nitrate/nitrite transporter NarK n=1 Tax=Mesobacillus persicus TaxID=930146 RepID=A0A1H7WJG6_9BACI|nr:MFS transporter [Mesobacillus persicus]SEM21179.1 Nitrate/nitrite transporter NarK [Mesobacillus persicus]